MSVIEFSSYKAIIKCLEITLLINSSLFSYRKYLPELMVLYLPPVYPFCTGTMSRGIGEAQEEICYLHFETTIIAQNSVYHSIVIT